MRILIDTHLLVWAMTGSDKLTDKAKGIISDEDNWVYCSVISPWEMSMKYSKGPDEIGINGDDLLEYAHLAGYDIVQIEESHIRAYKTISKREGTKKHGDPFDRMLLAQAKAENMVLLTHDKRLTEYGEKYVVLV